MNSTSLPVVTALISSFMLVQVGVPVSAHDKGGNNISKHERSMKKESGDVGGAVKKDSKTAGHDIKDGFEDIGSEVKGMFKKK
jgi:hypothetical protein